MKKIPILLFLVCTYFCSILYAQEAIFSLDSPYNTIYSHLYYLQSDTYQPELAAQTLNTKDSLNREKLAIQLKQIFDGKGLYVRVNQLPRQRDFIDSTSQQAFYTIFPKELPAIYVEKVNGQWLYSTESIKAIPRLHKEVYPFGSDLLVNFLPKTGQYKVLGLALWQHFGIFLILLFTFLIYALLNRVLRPLIRKLTQSNLASNLIPPKLIWAISRLVSILIVLRLLLIFLPVLQLPIEASNFAFLLLKIISTVVLIAIFLRLIDVVMLHAKRLSKTTESKLDEQLVPIIKRTLQAIVVIGGMIQILRLLDVNVTALIAGVSIGGLALALAAQDTVKNLIGSAMIFVDRPFQIGDYITSGSFSGSVVEVGFRTTRLRTADSSIISVPNGTIANMSVTNLGVRVYRLFTTNLGITYDTPPDLIEVFLEALKTLIKKHPDTSNEQYFVHLSELGNSSLNIFFRAFLKVNSYDKELAVKEDLILGIIRLAQALEIRFAFPSSTIHIEDFPEKEGKTPQFVGEKSKYQQKVNDFLKDFSFENEK